MNDKILIGWQEWCMLPQLNIPAIKAKIDTGAKTSALHAFDITLSKKNQQHYVHFTIFPLRHSKEIFRQCSALLHDERTVKNSAGHTELRYIICTPIMINHLTWDIEISLTNRDPMLFRMLLGRSALKHFTLIDPEQKCCQGKISLRKLKNIYTTS